MKYLKLPSLNYYLGTRKTTISEEISFSNFEDLALPTLLITVAQNSKKQLSFYHSKIKFMEKNKLLKMTKKCTYSMYLQSVLQTIASAVVCKSKPNACDMKVHNALICTYSLRQ